MSTLVQTRSEVSGSPPPGRSVDTSPARVGASGPFHRVIQRESDTTLIVFSSWDTPAGRFRPYRAVLPLPYTLIFVNAPDNAWYLGGIPGLGETADAVVGSLSRIVAETGCRRLATFGSSMGGFGALALGIDLGADVIIGHGVETLIGLRGSRSARGVGDRRLIPIGRDRARSWREVMPRFRGRLHIYYGETDVQDALHAAWLRRLTGLSAVPVRGAGHDVERFIAATCGLPQHLQDIVEGRAEEFSARFRAPEPPIREVAQVYRRRTLGVATERFSDGSAGVWPGTHLSRLVDALLIGDRAGAVAVAEAAVRGRPDLAYFHYALIVTLMQETAGVVQPPQLAVRRSYLPGSVPGAASGHVVAVDTVGDPHVFLMEVLDTRERVRAGAMAAAEACRRCPDVGALADLRDRLTQCSQASTI